MKCIKNAHLMSLDEIKWYFSENIKFKFQFFLINQEEPELKHYVLSQYNIKIVRKWFGTELMLPFEN
jgi:hypothetical protein